MMEQVGGFLRFNEISRPQIAHFCERFFNIQALFLRHADFLGAIGALDEASRDQGWGVEQTRTKGWPNSPRLIASKMPPTPSNGTESGGGGGGGGGGGTMDVLTLGQPLEVRLTHA